MEVSLVSCTRPSVRTASICQFVMDCYCSRNGLTVINLLFAHDVGQDREGFILFNLLTLQLKYDYTTVGDV